MNILIEYGTVLDVNSPSNRELWLDTNTVSSRSLEDDMIESLERIHHREVTNLQMDFHERTGDVVGIAEDFQSQVVYAHPYQGFNEWNTMESDPVETWVDIERSKMEETIEALEGLLEYRKNQVREWLAR